MQFGHTFDRKVMHILPLDPRFGPTYLNEVVIADGFYCIGYKVEAIPKLVVIFPTKK